MHWLPYPSPDPENPGHFKEFCEVFGQNVTTEDHVPSLVNNVRQVSEEQQVNSKWYFVNKNGVLLFFQILSMSTKFNVSKRNSILKSQ